MMMKKYFALIVLSVFTFSQVILSQTISPENIKNLKVDELSDDQVRTFMQNVEDRGMTLEQLEVLAMSRGMSPVEIQKLKLRINKLGSSQKSASSEDNNMRSFDFAEKEEDIFYILLQEKAKLDTSQIEELHKIFGYSLFNNKNLSFEPSLNIPTPQNYQIGPGDEIVINVWGASQQDYALTVSPEGSIRITDLGPIHVNGLTIESATNKIIKRLQAIYSGLAGENPNTYAQISLGNLRSIKINITGEAMMPGTYTLPSLATAFNALYYAGGPGIKGSFRNISIIREGNVISNIDLYEFLIMGKSEGNIMLKDQDVIFIPPFKTRIEVQGEVKRPGIFEMKEDEPFSSLVEYFGDFSMHAYRKTIHIMRNTEKEKTIVDISPDEWNSFKMHNGDNVIVDPIIDRYTNRVEITGAVFKPGNYELKEGLTIKNLIENAEGLKEDAFMPRALIYRLQPNNKTEVLSVDLDKVFRDENEDVPLQREDLVTVFSIFDLEEEYAVKIEGEVQFPGVYSYYDNLKLGEVLVSTGGLKESASLAKIEIARRIKDKKSIKPRNKVAQVFTFSISENLNINDSAMQFTLRPYDVIFVRKSPGYQEQNFVLVNGEVSFPGKYSITTKNDRISDLIKMAGGLTDEAYISGAKFRRTFNVGNKERLNALKSIQNESNDSVEFNIETESEQSIGIDLKKIMKEPGSKFDLFLQEGDVLEIPKQLQTVTMTGAFLYPITARYDRLYRFRKYVSHAGGFAQDAKRNKTYVIYANGSVKRTHSFMGINFFPGIEPGSEIIVPKKPEKQRMSTQELVGLTSVLSSTALVIITVINNL